MSFRNDRFNRAMRSLDTLTVDPAKDRNRSDDGLGVKRMIEALDYDSDAADARETTLRSEREERLFEAEMRLADAGNGHLIPVLLLIVENGSNREESLKHVARATYFRHRGLLCRFFCQSGAPGGRALPAS